MRRIATLAALAAAWLVAGRAAAFCRAAVCPASADPGSGGAGGSASPAMCPGSGGGGAGGAVTGVCTPAIPGYCEVCDPPEPGDCGAPIYWAQPCVSFDVQQNASSQVDWATADRILQQAFSAWTSADCGDGPPSIAIQDFGPVACDQVQYNHDGYDGNANILIFEDQVWDPANSAASTGADTLALTTVTYDVCTNYILDADIQVNTIGNQFTTDTSGGGGGGGGGGDGCPAQGPPYDLLSVLTHETGHFLGLAHTKIVAPATMDPSYCVTMSTLAADDIAAVCTAYPPGRVTNGDSSCIPHHGWSSQCAGEQAGDQTFGSCAAGRAPRPEPRAESPGGTAPEGSGASALMLLAALGARRLRGRSARRRS